MFDPKVFKMKDGLLMFTKAANRNWIGEVWWTCPPESMVTEVWSLCHQSDLGGHRVLEGTLNKFLKRFFLLSARQKIHFLKGGTDYACENRAHGPLLAGYVGKKLWVDLVSMLETIRGNKYMLRAEDSFCRYCRAYPIPNKEALTVAKVLMDHLFNVNGLPNQLQCDQL